MTFLKKFWKWLVALVIGFMAFFILWRLRRRESELLVLRARVDSLLQELKEKEAMLRVAQNSKEVEALKADINERKEKLAQQLASYEEERKALQAKIERIARAQNWEDLQ